MEQYLLVTPDSSSHTTTSSTNMADSPTISEYQAGSTDPECDRWKSSPSTSYTSAHDSESEADAAMYSNNADSARGKVNMGSLEQGATAATGIPPASRAWKMPFAKSSAPPRASSPARPSDGHSNHPGGSPQRRKAHSSNKTFRLSAAPQTQVDDGSFVETTSEKAALALAQHWNDVHAQAESHGKQGTSKVATSGNDYVVVARVESGKRMYKIRPRSRPPTLAEMQEKHVPQRAKASAASRTLQMPPSIRLTRSIPNLRTRTNDDNALNAISRDRDGFYRPAGASAQAGSAYLTLPVEHAHHHLSADTAVGRTSRPILHTAVSIPNLRTHRDHDVFGKLLGWSEPSVSASNTPVAGTSPRSPTGRRTSVSVYPTSTAHQSHGISTEQAPPVGTTARASLDDCLHTGLSEPFPYDLSPSMHDVSQSSIPKDNALPSNSTSSPFGHGVKLPSQSRLKRKKSIRQLHGTITVPSPEERANNTFDSGDSFDTSIKVRSLREVGSSETIRTATGARTSSEEQALAQLLDSPRTPMAVQYQMDAWMSDTRIFDSLQCNTVDNKASTSELKDSLRPMDEGNGRRHERGMSNTSLVSLGGSSMHSTNSATSAGGQAHTITVTSIPGDDRRFVIWGRRPNPSMRPPVRQTSNSRMSPASFSSSTSIGSSKRSSNQRKHDINEQLTPPTSASSPSSPWSSSPLVQKVILAATVDRWIADMTSRIENDLMTDFFLTYRSFLTPLSLCKLLITRFEWALQSGHSAEDIAGRRIVRVRTYVVLRHWLLNYFHEDFVPDRELRLLLTTWLNRMGKDERLRPNPTDLRLIKSLKKVVKRLKAAYSIIGVDQAADANTLIKTSLEADPQSRSRLRSDSMASMSSLHSIREEQVEMPTVHDTLSAPSTEPPAHLHSNDIGACDTETHPKRQDVRTSSSEDDVDLETDLHVSGYDSDELPRIPPTIPISPPPPRQYSPSHAKKSRSPQLGFQDRSSRPIEGVTLIPDNHRVSRAIASTVGSFSKLRRMMGNRRQPGHPSGSMPRYYNDTFPDTHQLSALQSGLPDPHMGYSSGRDERVETGDSPGLGIFATSTSLSSSSSSTPSAASATPDLRHTASSGTMRRQSMRPVISPGDNTKSQEPVAVSLSFSAKNSLAPAADIRAPDIQLDDYDSSGDESSIGATAQIRTLRRLPAARDLRGGRTGGHMPLAHRHSIDSIASYATRRLPSCALEPIRIPSIATYDSNSSVPDNDLDAMLDQGLIPYFVPPTDSEDEDEPGDVEAALRRLEGQVDDAKQQSNATRVERYLKMSEQAKSSGGYVYGEDAEASDEDEAAACRPASLAMSVAFDEPPSQSHTQETAVLAEEMGAERAPPARLPDQPSRPQVVPAEASLAVPHNGTDGQKETRTLQRKSSMRRFFGSTMSVSLWPMNKNMPKASKPSINQISLYHSFLFSYKVDVLAKHFCIIERDLLEKVTWQELISASWRERLDLEDFTDWDSFMKIRAKLNSDVQEQALLPPSIFPYPKRVGDVQTIIYRFNLMCKWIASEIVLTTSTAERAVLLTKIIKLAFKSYQMYNFQTATQIVHALQLPSIERLKKTWSKVPSFEQRLYSQLKFFCSPLRDFRLLREATGALASQWGPPGQEDRDPDMTLSGIPGALPFFGLILRDLAIANELPTFLDPSNPRAPADIDDNTMLLPAYADPSEFADLLPLPEGLPLRPLINIHKYRTVAKTIQLVMTFKELAGAYPYEPELPLYRKCLTIQCLPMAKIAELSSACER